LLTIIDNKKSKKQLKIWNNDYQPKTGNDIKQNRENKALIMEGNKVNVSVTCVGPYHTSGC
jgi:hypothetical protein